MTGIRWQRQSDSGRNPPFGGLRRMDQQLSRTG